ncbi:MAG: sialate O-acetylesterase [Bacteroidales bacterium]|nr:sialate O-acetylesterase [Bacteroidales bacterium]
MHRISVFIGLIITIALISCKQVAKKELKPAQIFTDNMVLQQKQKVPIWGSATPGEKVEIRFREQSVETKADENGKWKAELNNLTPGKADSLIIIADDQKLVFHNVSVGEVWICSGQSNMEMNVGCTWAKLNNAEQEIANANFPDIRLFIVERNTAFAPLDTISTEGWKVCSPETIGPFSAVGYFFGREIHQSQKVPVGLIQTAWGGTVAEAWTSAESLKWMRDFAGSVEKLSKMSSNKDSLKLQYEKDYASWLLETAEADAGINGTDTIFASPDFDDTDWMKIKVPGMVEQTAIGAVDGVFWFRKKVKIPTKQLGKDLTLTIAPPDDTDETWFNGVKIGESTEWDVVRNYKIPSRLVKEGENQIVVRLGDPQGDGGFMGNKEDFSIYSADGWKMQIKGDWLCKVGYDKRNIKTIPMVPDEPNRPTVLYNAMINPIIPFAIKGAIWYQGESNSGMAYQYQTLFPAMIKDWRSSWNQGDFPFLFVQLANYQQRNTLPVEDSWAELREAQLMTLNLPNTGMAVSIDIGDGNDIHPGNKQDVGKRLALAALNKVYNEDIPYSGPMYKSMKIEGEKIILDFDFKYDGLLAKNGEELKGFAIAGSDKKFVWAKAEIKDNQVLVYANKIKQPVAVRYAWSSNPECNLTNSAGLPASPFRTDKWKGITQPEPD